MKATKTNIAVQIAWDIIKQERLSKHFLSGTKGDKKKIICVATHEAYLIITEIKLELENCGYLNFTIDDKNRLAEAHKHIQKLQPWYKRLPFLRRIQ